MEAPLRKLWVCVQIGLIWLGLVMRILKIIQWCWCCQFTLNICFFLKLFYIYIFLEKCNALKIQIRLWIANLRKQISSMKKNLTHFLKLILIVLSFSPNKISKVIKYVASPSCPPLNCPNIRGFSNTCTVYTNFASTINGLITTKNTLPRGE